MGNVKSILIVCTGNSCRSVMAEALLKKYLKESGKGHIKVSSAGISTIDGFSPTEETVDAMKKEGIDVSGFTSRSIAFDMVREAGLILVMEDRHKDEILRLAPDAKGKTYLVKEFGIDKPSAGGAVLNIADPIGKPMEVYERCLEEIKDQMRRIAKLL